MEKENKTQLNIPKLRFSGFNEEWNVKKLGDLSDLITKGTTPKQFTKSGIKFIKIECFDGNSINSDKCLFIDENTHNKELKRSILQENDILFAIAGATIGKVNFVNKDILPANTNQALSIIRLKKDQNKDFVFCNLKSHKMKRYIIDSISVGAQPNLNLEQMNKFSFSVPSLPEQQKIADFLSSVDGWINNLKQQKENLESYKKGMMQRIFSQEIRFKDKDGKEFSEWNKINFGDILIEYNEKTKINNQYDILSSTMNGVVLQSEYFNKTIASSDNTGYKILKRNQLVFSPQNLWLGNINFCSNFDIGIVSPSYKIYNINKDLILIDYLKNIIKTPRMIYEYTISSEQGASVVRRGLNMDLFYIIPINLPSIQEQQKIADFLSNIDDLIEIKEEEINNAEEWKKGLMQQMFV